MSQSDFESIEKIETKIQTKIDDIIKSSSIKESERNLGSCFTKICKDYVKQKKARNLPDKNINSSNDKITSDKVIRKLFIALLIEARKLLHKNINLSLNEQIELLEIILNSYDIYFDNTPPFAITKNSNVQYNGEGHINKFNTLYENFDKIIQLCDKKNKEWQLIADATLGCMIFWVICAAVVLSLGAQSSGLVFVTSLVAAIFFACISLYARYDTLLFKSYNLLDEIRQDNNKKTGKTSDLIPIEISRLN